MKNSLVAEFAGLLLVEECMPVEVVLEVQLAAYMAGLQALVNSLAEVHTPAEPGAAALAAGAPRIVEVLPAAFPGVGQRTGMESVHCQK